MRRVGGSAAVVAALAANLFAVVPPVAADTIAQAPKPGVIGPAPAPGDVVAAGSLEVAAFAVSDVAIARVDLVIDGAVVAATLSGADATYQRVGAFVDAAAGDHIVDLTVTDTHGRTARRLWRFSAVPLSLRRVAGADRVTTAVAVSQARFTTVDGAAAAVVARADAFPDALAAAPLSAAVAGPLLLTPGDALHAAVADELDRVLSNGATVYVLGGTAALSASVESAIAARGYVVERLAGVDRYATAVAVAEALADQQTTPVPDLTDESAAFVVSGATFPDALAASAPAARDGLPILLTDPSTLPTSTRGHLVDVAYDRLYVVGGNAAVSAAVEDELRGLATDVIRVAGDGRYTTAAAVVTTFYDEAPEVGVASGEDFADALAGGADAGARGVPLLLAPRDRLAAPQAAQLHVLKPVVATIYGGDAAVAAIVERDLLRSIVDGEGPGVLDVSPPPNSELQLLDTLQILFDRDVDLNHTSVYVTLDGQEVYGTIAQGDFPSAVVFRAGALPVAVEAYRPYDLTVVALAYDGTAWTHVEEHFTLRTLELARGDSNQAVLELQQRLTALGYWVGTPEGTYGNVTVQAVMAFQKANGLARTGAVDEVTFQALTTAGRAQPRTTSGYVVEIDKTRQILMVVDDGRVLWTFNTSTGNNQQYRRPQGGTGTAYTPEGWTTMSRHIDGMRTSPLGQMWRPKYFTSSGHAFHGSTSVPAYPASHGCARLSYPAIDFIWEANLVPLGTNVYVYS